MNKLKVIIPHDSGTKVWIERPAASSLDCGYSVTLDVTEVDDLVALLQNVKKEMANRKRYAAEQLLAQAEGLDPKVRQG